VQPFIDPEIAAALAAFPIELGNLRTEDLPALRSGISVLLDVELSDAVERSDHTVAGEPDVTVRIHRPAGQTQPLPCMYSIHGGGYVLGSYDMDDARFDRWCPMFDLVGVSVEYRLAPEHPFPAPLDDCYAGLKWVYDNASELGVDRGAIGIAGGSAGGGLAAGLALLARDRGEIPLAFQLLVYPMLDDRQTSPSSQWEVPVWPPGANRFGWEAYLGSRYGGEIPIYAAAARATDLTGLPPTFIMVGGADGFADEDIAYAQRLNHAGVPTELHVYPGGPHGFDGLTAGTDLAKRAQHDMEEWVARTVRAKS
jgi:acetyl esterase/lipase